MSSTELSDKSAPMNGLIQVYTGEGKGKTTAALGLALRAVGAGYKVAIIFFDKGGERYSERQALAERFKGDIDFFATGLDRRDPATGQFRTGVTAEDQSEAEKGLELAQAALAGGQYELVILDEILTVANLKMLSEGELLALVKIKRPETELVMTGRGCPEAVKQAADLVSEIRAEKHPFTKGIPAREGIDY